VLLEKKKISKEKDTVTGNQTMSLVSDFYTLKERFCWSI